MGSVDSGTFDVKKIAIIGAGPCDIRHLIRFSTQVKNVSLRREGSHDRWDVDTVNLLDGQKSKDTFDAVVVANGHYATPFIPDVKNIKEFDAAHPGVISHAKTYRVPEDYAGKKVLVVGNASSGLDIASQISRHSKSPLLLSVHEPTPDENLEHVRAEEVPAIEEFLVEEKGVRFTDGRVEKDLDAILYCTGWEEEEAKRHGKSFHVFPKLGDADLLDEFRDWVKQSSSSQGKEPPVWNAEQKWERGIYVEGKAQVRDHRAEGEVSQGTRIPV
ncbi:hypothetical protein INS49_014746 [Diaporthe citri]|uniref:uncharacterized protein n=1 Tax=Diaporthe citri TaxID=83186 RepID=UPI001C80E150|nr:uncharacterized protein INS49_014746 [Diaporthe citri]KAG6356871.1 hypothetical protein INS49_014746 [Diaporthe citri]